MLTDQWFVAMSQVGEGDPTGKSIAQKPSTPWPSGEVPCPKTGSAPTTSG